MRNQFVLVFIFSSILSSYSQTVQWASKVIDFSSQLTNVQYAATQALGKPNVLPAGGQNPSAWTPDKPNRAEHLKLGFDNPISIQQIAIAESFNPSALHRVLLYDEAGKEYVAYTLSPRTVPLEGRMLNIFIDKTPYKVAAVKLEFDGAAVRDYYGIDAVGISDSNYPVVALVPTPELLARGIVVESLGENVNSDLNEFKPLLSPDGKTLYFSRRNSPENVGGVEDEEDIWYSTLGADGDWQVAKNMGPPFNNEHPNFANSIVATTPDGRGAIMLLGNKYLPNGNMEAGISISTFEDGKWSTPVSQTIINDYNVSEKANYFMTNDRKVLIASIQRHDSHGDRDLYVSFSTKENEWSEPLNLGRTINTASVESAPFMMDDNKTLYFSSDGFSGYGGADIYVTERLDDTWKNWSEPKNLGPDINSTYDDLFFSIPNYSDYAYYSRGVSLKDVDIYRVKLPIFRAPDVWVTVRGKLTDGATGKPMGANLLAEQMSDGTSAGTVQSNPETGEYEIKLKAGSVYGLRVETKDHVAGTKTVDFRDVTSAKTMENQDFVLQPSKFARIEPNVSIRFNDIFLDYNKATINIESFPELNRIVAYMQENIIMNVVIGGHTCDLGSEKYNIDLSRRRAEAVQKYLVDKGVQKSRTRIVYFGEEQPAVENINEANRKLNRRVEFKFVRS